MVVIVIGRNSRFDKNIQRCVDEAELIPVYAVIITYRECALASTGCRVGFAVILIIKRHQNSRYLPSGRWLLALLPSVSVIGTCIDMTA